MTKFAVSFHPRSGSSWLISSLAQVAGSKVDYEILNDPFPATAQLQEFTNFFETDVPNDATSLVGFKFAPYQIIDKLGFIEAIHAVPDLKIIQLERENIVKATFSEIRGIMIYRLTQEKYGEGNPNLVRESDRLGRYPVDLNLFQSTLREKLTAKLDLHFMMSQINLETIKIKYEEMYFDQENVENKIRDYLNIEDFSLRKSLTKKLTSDQLSDDITNFEELREAYAGTEFYNMFSE